MELADLVARKLLFGEATTDAESLYSQEFLVRFLLRFFVPRILKISVQIVEHLEGERVEAQVVYPL